MNRFKINSSLLTLLCFALILKSAFADEPTEKARYTIKQDKPSVGSSMRQVIVIAGTIPLNKTYDQLTPEEKNTLKSNYENMPASDEPPFPVDGLMPIYKSIGHAHENLSLKYKGKLTMYVLVDSQGKPKSVSVDASPDPEITNAVAHLLMLQKFKPAICSGQPCSMEFPVTADLVGPMEEDFNGQNPGVLINRSNTGM
jgi:hypothetical protein